MNEILTRNIKHLLTSLVAQGVHDFVVSPGSRTTPFALLLAEMQAVRDDVRVTVDRYGKGNAPTGGFVGNVRNSDGQLLASHHGSTHFARAIDCVDN